MDSRSTRAAGWVVFSAVVLAIGGLFALIDGLMAVYRSTFFSQTAVYLFSGLHTWGWITFAVGVVGIASGIVVLSGRQWARWLGVTVAGLSALGQLLFAQAYPLWSLMIMSIDFLVIYGLTVYGARESAASAGSRYEETSESRGTSGVTDVSDQTRRAA